MKKFFSVMVVAVIAAMSVVAYADTPIQQSQLPKAAQTFLTKYFPSDKVRKAKMDEGYRGTEYEVDLVSGAEIDFRSDGTWKEVKAARGKAVPSGIVPKAIATHVSKNYPGLSIIEISRKRGGYEVELSNGSELKLTEDAKPLPAYGGKGGHGGKGAPKKK